MKAPLAPPGAEECWIEISGARMRYLRAGSGPPLILLHGLLGYSFSWRFTLPALAPYATVYAPDMIGAGFSDRPHNFDHSMRATALRIVEFAEKLHLDSFDLLGTSRGGAVAMSVVNESLKAGKPHIRRLILVAPVNPYSAHGKRLAPFAGGRIGAPLVRAIMTRLTFLHPYFHSRMYGHRSLIPPGTLEGYMAPLATPGLFEHGLSIVRTWTPDLRELESLLPNLKDVPTFLMWGTKDTAVYASSMQPLSRHFANVQTITFPGIGHLPYEECANEFNHALIQFLTA